MICRLGLLLTLLLMTINLNNSATENIPPSGFCPIRRLHDVLGIKHPKNEIRTDDFTISDGICPLILWILINIAFILVALFEYFLILVLLRFGNKVG